MDDDNELDLKLRYRCSNCKNLESHRVNDKKRKCKNCGSSLAEITEKDYHYYKHKLKKSAEEDEKETPAKAKEKEKDKKKKKKEDKKEEKEEKEEKEVKEVKNKPDKNKENNNEVVMGNVREAVKGASNAAAFVGKVGIQEAAVKEAGKVIVKKTVQTVVTDTVEVAAISATSNTIEAVVVNAVEKTVTNTVEKIAIESTKELAEAGLKEGTKIAVNVAKEAVITTVAEGSEQIIVAGTKESVKTITETIVVQQGGKAWLINLGKAVPFIGAALSATMNTFSTAKLGKKMVDKFNKEFDDNQQRKVDLIKGRIYGLFNIIEQMKSIIEDEDNKINF
jgi:ribosomal protein L37AE/L43A